jgi:hypothetical protein
MAITDDDPEGIFVELDAGDITPADGRCSRCRGPVVETSLHVRPPMNLSELRQPGIAAHCFRAPAWWWCATRRTLHARLDGMED